MDFQNIFLLHNITKFFFVLKKNPFTKKNTLKSINTVTALLKLFLNLFYKKDYSERKKSYIF